MYIWQVKKLIFLFFIAIANTLCAQDSARQKKEDLDAVALSLQGGHGMHDSDAFNKKRFYIISSVHGTAYAGTFFLLSQAWYKDYPKTSFHTFNDSKEWLQIDKVGHSWTAYNIAKYSTSMWHWTGMQREKAVLLGGASSIGYQTILEVLDAHSAEWGWSWADMAANVSGTGIYTAQELLWQEQRFLFKFSSHKIKYEDDLIRRANSLYGRSLPERILKDYNGQTYWLSMNVRSMFTDTRLPPWLNMAVGYGAKGLFGGFENKALDNSGNVTFDRTDIRRQRQWYLSPDIDFTRIKTNKKGFKVAFSILNLIKVPAPALELSGGKIRGRLFYF